MGKIDVVTAYVLRTKALLHFNGTNGSADATDETGRVWTPHGSYQLYTADKKFGSASSIYDGVGDYIDTPDHADFDVGSGDFTVDFWFKTSSNNQYIFGQGNSTATASSISIYGFINSSHQARITIVSGSTSYTATFTASVVDDTVWHHFAGIRSGNNLYCAIDGVFSPATDVTGVTVNNSANKFSIGRMGEYTSNNYTFLIDEFRFTKGFARWTSGFTVPAVEHAVD